MYMIIHTDIHRTGRGKKRGRGRPKKQTGPAAKKLKSDPSLTTNAAEAPEGQANGSGVKSGQEVTIEPRMLDLNVILKSAAKTKAAKGDTVSLKIKVESATENKNIVIDPQTFDVKMRLPPETPAKGKKKTESRIVALNLMIEPKVSKQHLSNSTSK